MEDRRGLENRMGRGRREHKEQKFGSFEKCKMDIGQRNNIIGQ